MKRYMANYDFLEKTYIFSIFSVSLKVTTPSMFHLGDYTTDFVVGPIQTRSFYYLNTIGVHND